MCTILSGFHLFVSEIIFHAKTEITQFSIPSEGMNRSVIAGRNITFVSRTVASEGTVDIEWYKSNQRTLAAYVQFFNNKCELRKNTSNKLYVEETDCKDGLFQLRIRNIDTSFEDVWYCLITTGTPPKRYQSQYINIHVLRHGKYIVT